MARISLFTLVALTALSLSVGLPAAQQRPTFRASRTVVPVYVTVADSQQRLVSDLVQDDFELYDNDKLQEIAVFENRPQPINVVVMLDTSLSMQPNISLVNRASEQFFLRLFPGDKAMVGAFNDKIQLMADFTSNRDTLIAELRHQDFGNATYLWAGTNEAMNSLKKVDGRHVVLLFTDGGDTGGRGSLGGVMDRAREEEVMVYSIGLAGANGSRSTRDKPDGGLRKLAEETGGGYFELLETADLGSTFTRVAQELHSQYLLGFTPATFDNKTHKLTVKLKKPGMTSRARKTYVAREQGADDGK